MEITKEQRAAIDSRGKVIVSASAGSGKTFVMIEKLVAAIENGVDLDSVLAVTFTKKAAAQMKEKLRKAIIARCEGASPEKKAALKIQLNKIPSAGISTIHAFCAKLLRTYFYAVGIDGTFDIISADDAAAKEYKTAAIESLFDRYYEEDNPNLKVLLDCYRKKRSDGYLKSLILSSYEKLRVNADYLELAQSVPELYTDEGFARVSIALNEWAAEQYGELKTFVENFARDFNSERPEYARIFGEMISSLELAAEQGIFAPPPQLAATRKPSCRTEEEKAEGERFSEFRELLAAKYKAVRGDVGEFDTEWEVFLKSGETAIALARVLVDFDAEYTAVKRDENKLDYNDLEHLTLKLLSDEGIRREINEKYKFVFVDEYQDVNPVQEKIISLASGGETFLVGDVKQAIYGFRGSKSLFFAQKFHRHEEGDGSALRLSNNFRSSDGVLDFVNRAFTQIMTSATCGIDYADGNIMLGGGGYPAGDGDAVIHIFGKDEEEQGELGVYSVTESAAEVRHTREGLAVLEIVKRELKSKHYDLKSGEYVDTQPGDICILTRKRNKSAAGIVRALTDAGYPVSGAQDNDLVYRPEVRQIIDILSYIDNTLQDIPLATAMLSPLGGFTYDELSAIRIAFKGQYRAPFRECCRQYAEKFENRTALKIKRFEERTEYLRDIAEVLDAAELIDEICEHTGLEAVYSAGGGEKLKNIRRLAAEGTGISLSAFLRKLRGGYQITVPVSASTDSIKIMTMHASKGLEFPVVIIADICAPFKGKETGELPLDETFGFAPKYFDKETMLTRSTVLRRLTNERAAREELKNELNLFYVACTRAMCRLHIMAKEVTLYNPLEAQSAGCYAKLFDMSEFKIDVVEPSADGRRELNQTLISAPDEEALRRIDERFMREYARVNSVNLPVKSSASAILRLSEDEPLFRTHELFTGEGETGTERGTAYHRFLELCDFCVKDAEGIAAEIEKFTDEGRISPAQRDLLSADDLAEILGMPVFDIPAGTTVYREREFLCRMPANELFETDADDGVLVQGAIDLLVERNGYTIIDYKYSHKDDVLLVKTYSKQLALYKNAVARIMRVDPATISTYIVNIFKKQVIEL